MALTKPQWTFPVGSAANHYMRSLPVFHVLPNWKDGITETLEWVTDVMSSEQAVEQRRSVRRFPRRSFEMSFLRTDAARARIENFLAGVGKRDHLVPIWHEQFKLGEPLPNGKVQFPEDSLAEREFIVNDLVLLTTGDMDHYAVLTVTAVNVPDDHITLMGVTGTGTWPQGSRIVPLRRAKVLDQSTMENVTDRAGVTRIRFQLQDTDARFTPSWGYCSPLWRTKPNRSSPVKMDFARSDYTLDLVAGIIEVTDPGNRAQISQSMDIVLFGRSQVWAYRSFLYNARGRARRFYVPTFMSDIQAKTDLGGKVFDALPNGFNDYFQGPQEARRIIGVDFKDGRPRVYRTIVNIAQVLSNVAPFRPVAERFTVDLDLPPVAVREIERISFVVPSRFDQDTIELFHPTDNCVAVRSSVVMRSSIVAGMPPIECWVTSRPYPVESLDALRGGALIRSGRLVSQPAPLDSLGGDALIVGGDLRELLQTIELPPEAMTTSLELLDGTLRQVQRTYDGYPPEEMETALTLGDGTLKLALIVYDRYPPESMRTAVVIYEGTLT